MWHEGHTVYSVITLLADKNFDCKVLMDFGKVECSGLSLFKFFKIMFVKAKSESDTLSVKLNCVLRAGMNMA